MFTLKIHDLSIGGKDKTAVIWLMARVDLQKIKKEPKQWHDDIHTTVIKILI